MESNATRVARGSRVTNLRPPHFVTPRALEGEWRQVLPQPSQVDGRIVQQFPVSGAETRLTAKEGRIGPRARFI